MIIAVLEDEPLVQRRLVRFIKDTCVEEIEHIYTFYDLSDAIMFLKETPIDLLFLDLNLNGDDGFDLLKHLSSYSFQIIIASANTDRAIEAFDYGVIVFIAKPLNKERIRIALDKYYKQQKIEKGIKYLSIRKHPKNELIKINDVKYIKGAGAYSDVFLQNGKVELHSKSLEKLMVLLPDQFHRIHKSYIANINFASCFNTLPGSKYELLLVEGDSLPVSRTLYKELKERISF